jgi:hypothetical protein
MEPSTPGKGDNLFDDFTLFRKDLCLGLLNIFTKVFLLVFHGSQTQVTTVENSIE